MVTRGRRPKPHRSFSRLIHQHSIFTTQKGHTVSLTRTSVKVPTCSNGDQGLEVG